MFIHALGVNTMKKIVYILITIILTSCSSSESIELKSNKAISETFNDSEIKDLQIIFDFFNQQICDSKNLNKDLLNECYEKYCSEIREQQKTENEFNPKVNFEKQLEMYKKGDSVSGRSLTKKKISRPHTFVWEKIFRPARSAKKFLDPLFQSGRILMKIGQIFKIRKNLGS